MNDIASSHGSPGKWFQIGAAVSGQHKKEKTNSGSRLTVPSRLNLLNLLVFISGLLSIFGAYEIQLGGTMHKLNYLHEKNLYELAKQVDEFSAGNATPQDLRTAILDVQQQPVDCLAVTNLIDRFAMRIIGTSRALEICENDIEMANDLLDTLSGFQAGTIDKTALVKHAEEAVLVFNRDGEEFQPLVDTTVSTVFLIVIIVVIGKAVFVPMFGLVLSKGVSADYKLLAATKDRLIVEREKNDAIQTEKLTAMSTMVAGLAHEINTPIGISITAASHLNSATKDIGIAYGSGRISHEDMEEFLETAKEANRIIQQNLNRSAELVGNFKQVSVGQSGDEARQLNIQSHVKDTLVSLGPKLKAGSHAVKLRCPDNIQAITYPGAMSQIIVNLITNSILHGFKSNNPGRIEIEITPRDAKHLKLVYTDDGVGIPNQIKSKIFNPFFTTKRGQGGTGLGLHILHNLVTQQLGGCVSIYDNEGGGARFEIVWPAEFHLSSPSGPTLSKDTRS